jgi:hypothetical protein
MTLALKFSSLPWAEIHLLDRIRVIRNQPFVWLLVWLYENKLGTQFHFVNLMSGLIEYQVW